MNLGIQGKRALITASGRGLGRNSALHLAAEGAVCAVVSRTTSDIEALLAELREYGSGHMGFTSDLVAEGAPETFVADLKKEFGMPDIIIHNLGGTLDVNDPLAPIAEWRKVWRANIDVAVELNHFLIPAMRERRWGRIVHIASISALENHGPVQYCSAKAALVAYTRSMGRFIAPDNVIMTALLPGAVLTKGGYWDQALVERPQHVEKYLTERMAIHRFGTEDEIGNTVTFLASDLASFCVGSVLTIDGGQGRGFFGEV